MIYRNEAAINWTAPQSLQAELAGFAETIASASDDDRAMALQMLREYLRR